MLAACTVDQNKQGNRDSTAAAEKHTGAGENRSLCFEHVSGNRNQDTALVYLKISGDHVDGELISLPYEKDRRKGNINGTIDGDIIKGVWTFSQEGAEDTLSFEFKLQNDRLLQKEYTVDKNSGRQILSNTGVFSIEYMPYDCSRMERRF